MSLNNRYTRKTARLEYIHSDECECDTYGDDQWGRPHEPTAQCTPAGVVVLPHQCDAWCVGSKQEVDQLIRDLIELKLRM